VCLLVADVAGVPGAPEPARRPGGAVPTADRLRVPPPLPQLAHNACRPWSQGLVWLLPGEPLKPKASVAVVLLMGGSRRRLDTTPCDINKLSNSLKLRKALGFDGIAHECFRHLPRRPPFLESPPTAVQFSRAF
jgi:hypothetical protein